MNEVKIKEAFCSFEVSMLLKDCGFDEECFSYYHKYSYDDFTTEDEYRYESNQYEAVWDGTSFYNHMSNNRVGRCTHQLAMAWVRENGWHIDISLSYDDNDDACYYVVIQNTKTFISADTDLDDKEFKTYEEAVEAALSYCLTNLI